MELVLNVGILWTMFLLANDVAEGEMFALANTANDKYVRDTTRKLGSINQALGQCIGLHCSIRSRIGPIRCALLMVVMVVQ